MVVYSFMLIYSFLLAGTTPLVGSSTLHLVLRFPASFLRYSDHRCQVLWYMDSSVIYGSRLANFMFENLTYSGVGRCPTIPRNPTFYKTLCLLVDLVFTNLEHKAMHIITHEVDRTLWTKGAAQFLYRPYGTHYFFFSDYAHLGNSCEVVSASYPSQCLVPFCLFHVTT
jgi:hypothetical protein